MAGVTGKSQIDQATRKFLAESRYTLQERPGVLASSVRRERLPEHQGPSVNIPKYGTVTTYYLTEGVDMAQAQQITDTLMTLTPAEYGAQVVLTDLMLMTVKDEFFRVAGRILAESFDRQREETMCDDLGNYSVAMSGDGAGQAMTVAAVLEAREGIKYGMPAAAAGRGGEPGPDPIYCVCTPMQAYDLKANMVGGLGAIAATQISPSLEKYSTGTEWEIAGTIVRTTVNINKDAADDAYMAVFSKEAQVLVELGPGPGVEKERDASLRGWELNFVGRWARGEYNDSWGLEGLWDSAAPA